MVLKFELRVSMVNAYLKCVDQQEGKSAAEGMDETPGCVSSNSRGGVMARWMGLSHGNCNNFSELNSNTRMELSLPTG